LLKPNSITIAGAVLALFMIGLFALILSQSAFPIFKFAASSSDRFINVTQNVGKQDSDFMWTSRTLDLAAQAFVIFAAAAGCLAILRVEKKEHESDD